MQSIGEVWPSRNIGGKEHELISSTFKKNFEDEYIPPTVKNQKCNEFLNLKQGNMTMVEYQRKFDELSSLVGPLFHQLS